MPRRPTPFDPDRMRACSQSGEPYAYTSEHDHGGEMTIELFVSGGDASKFLEPPEQPLDEIAGLVQSLAVAPRCDAIRPWRDDRLGAPVVQQFDERVSVVALVADHGGGLLRARDQR